MRSFSPPNPSFSLVFNSPPFHCASQHDGRQTLMNQALKEIELKKCVFELVFFFGWITVFQTKKNWWKLIAATSCVIRAGKKRHFYWLFLTVQLYNQKEQYCFLMDNSLPDGVRRVPYQLPRSRRPKSSFLSSTANIISLHTCIPLACTKLMLQTEV